MPERIGSNELVEILTSRGVSQELIREVLDSGYFSKHWVNPFTTHMYSTVSDLMYGNKGLSSSFDTDLFVRHLFGEHVFEPLPPFRETLVQNRGDVQSVLEDPARRRLMGDGSLSFRGQPSEYRFRRKVPNPRRAAQDGSELSIMPGLFRQTGAGYSFNIEPIQRRSFELFLTELEPNDDAVYTNSSFAYDIMRCEQHYATSTDGLDLSFDVETALFFATHRFKSANGLATYERVHRGSNRGVIYCFRFGSPAVKKTEYLIRDFDLFKTYRPERILRQSCGLPLIGAFERNIAVTEIDCVIRLDADFEYDGPLTPEYMFPNAHEDPFYGKLLSLKDSYPEKLSNVVEYAWARR